MEQRVGGRLTKVQLPPVACGGTLGSSCDTLVKNLQNPYFVGDQAGLTQLWGWTDAWTSLPSVYAVAARSTSDVQAAVNFAREHNIRLVVKGGGHSYQGTSNAPDSLLIWTRAMDAISLQEAFVPRGTSARPQSAITVGAGAVRMDVYNAATTIAGRYVQGGGCATVGVAGLIQSGGFGSFSKNYGLAAAGLLEAEIVTADGIARTVNESVDPELFWAIRGGGGGSFGVVTQLTLKCHDLPDIFGDVSVKVQAQSDNSFRKLITAFVDFYADKLFNPHWGESVSIGRHNVLKVDLVFQGLDKSFATKLWKDFLDHVTTLAPDISLASNFFIEALPARRWWDVDYLQKYSPGSVLVDPRPGQPRHHAWWTGDSEQVGSFLHGYRSIWLPQSLLRSDERDRLSNALFAASRRWTVGLHFNKALAGAPAAAIDAARATAINPLVLESFALAILSGGGGADYTGAIVKDSDANRAGDDRAKINAAAAELVRVAPLGGSYLSESDFFQQDWQKSFWGRNYARLGAVKEQYDPAGLFTVHHGVGSEVWSDDGFVKKLL